MSEVVDVSSAYLVPSCNSSSLDVVLSVEVKRTGDSRQPCCTPFSILNQQVVLYSVLTVAS